MFVVEDQSSADVGLDFGQVLDTFFVQVVAVWQVSVIYDLLLRLETQFVDSFDPKVLLSVVTDL